MENKEIINEVYKMLKSREIHPTGNFDKGGRWYSREIEFIEGIREPSRAWPYSQMTACRTKKYVKFISKKYNCKSLKDLLSHI